MTLSNVPVVSGKIIMTGKLSLAVTLYFMLLVTLKRE